MGLLGWGPGRSDLRDSGLGRVYNTLAKYINN